MARAGARMTPTDERRADAIADLEERIAACEADMAENPPLRDWMRPDVDLMRRLLRDLREGVAA